ncbi:MAG: hypothetical protein JW768_10640 [Chitinispirillaceae bacterium]|nr:hypothetical protein [Chitinispirillaceae bacterium]
MAFNKNIFANHLGSAVSHIGTAGVMFASITLMSPVSVGAGQLHVRYYGLSDVACQNGIAILGTISGVDRSKKRITFLARKVWTRPGLPPAAYVIEEFVADGSDDFYEKGKRYSVSKEKEFVAGRTYDITVYTGVVWDNPRKSPVDSRIRDYLNLDELTMGKNVIVVLPRRELITANKANVRKADFFFSANIFLVKGKPVDPCTGSGFEQPHDPLKRPDGTFLPEVRVSYGQKESTKQLIKDLGDCDFHSLAAAALKPLTVKLILSSAVGPIARYKNVLYDHYYSLTESEKTDFIKNSVRQLKVHPVDDQINTFLNFLMYHIPDEEFIDQKIELLVLFAARADTQEEKESLRHFARRIPAPLPSKLQSLLND